MKSQINLFILIILVTVSMVLIHFISNLIYGSRLEREISGIQIMKLYNFLSNALKAYSLLSLDYSTHQSLRESACLGGMITKEGQGWAWICGGQFNPLPVDKINDCNEKFIKYYLNVYYSNFSVNLPIKLSLNNFQSCDVEVDESGVLSGNYDEGNFWINCTEASFSVKGRDIYLFNKMNTSFYLTNNRFWYIYRKVWEWAKENYYGQCICAATKACKGCEAAKKCAEEALKRLQAKFDKNVTCRIEKTERCCRQSIGPICGSSTNCFVWPGACQVLCNQECGNPPAPQGLCMPENLVITKPSSSFYKIPMDTVYLQNSQDLHCYSKIWNEWRLAESDTYVCEDHKYYIPSSKGPIPLEFRIIAQASFRVPHPSCERTVSCNCPPDAKDCSQCISRGCTPCE